MRAIDQILTILPRLRERIATARRLLALIAEIAKRMNSAVSDQTLSVLQKKCKSHDIGKFRGSA